MQDGSAITSVKINSLKLIKLTKNCYLLSSIIQDVNSRGTFNYARLFNTVIVLVVLIKRGSLPASQGSPVAQAQVTFS